MKAGSLVVICLAVIYVLVPSAIAASLSRTLDFGLPTDTAGVPDSTEVDKRNKGVDAWSICPPQMTDVDCFYAYLRVYARLRKAAEESDRVSMRNIGKRAPLTSSGPSETEKARSRLRRMRLCLDDMPPVVCYLTAVQLYHRVQDDLGTGL